MWLHISTVTNNMTSSILFPTLQTHQPLIWLRCLVLSSDFNCKENDGTWHSSHLMQTFFWRKTRLLRFVRLLPLLATYGCSPNSEATERKAISDKRIHYENTRALNTFTQMLLAINRRYWQADKIHACVWSFKVASSKRASLKSHRFSKKKQKTVCFRPHGRSENFIKTRFIIRNTTFFRCIFIQ